MLSRFKRAGGRTVAARAVISISISLPSSSFLGFAVTTVACRVGEAENVRHCCKRATFVNSRFNDSADFVVETTLLPFCVEEGGGQHDLTAKLLLRLVDSFRWIGDQALGLAHLNSFLIRYSKGCMTSLLDIISKPVMYDM